MIIYKTTNLVNGKQYIGRDSHNNPNYLGSGNLLKLAIRKYGKENFKKEVIDECMTFQDLVEREEYWLNYYDAGNNPLFYNLHNGGKGIRHTDEMKKQKSKRFTGEGNPFYGKTHTKETITRMIQSHSNINHPFYGKHLSDEHKKRISISLSGENSPQFGKPIPYEIRKKISESNTGKVKSEETKQKLREINIGRKHTDETKSKISSANKGINNPMYGNLGENSPGFKGYIVCVAGDYIGQRKTNKEWCDILGIIRQNFHTHLTGEKYKNGIKGNFFRWEDELK